MSYFTNSLVAQLARAFRCYDINNGLLAYEKVVGSSPTEGELYFYVYYFINIYQNFYNHFTTK